MRSKAHIAIASVLLAGAAAFGQSDPPGGQQPAIRVHLPRAVRADGETLRLGSIALVRGADATLVQEAQAVAMGRAPWSRESIVIDRTTILSRLAQHGIDAGTVLMTGAEKVLVTRNESIIDADRLVKSAECFLQKAQPGPAGCLWRLLRQPDDLAVALAGGAGSLAAKDIALRCRLAKECPKDHVKVEVVAEGSAAEASGGEPELLGVGEVIFRLVYPVRQVVAVRDIAAGEPLSPLNVKVRIVHVEKAPQGSPEDSLSQDAPFYGMVAARAVPAGAVIPAEFMVPPKPVVVVRRNQTVTMKVEGMAFLVTGVGQALQDGRTGEIIKVRNIDSNRIVAARVSYDGTVRPVTSPGLTALIDGGSAGTPAAVTAGPIPTPEPSGGNPAPTER